MKRVSIWDLDYYHASDKTNCFNTDVMKISSYHKQLGDSINFVVKQDDIFRPFDIYYIIREKESTPLPPKEFFLNRKVKWWGKAFKTRAKWKMSDQMLGCRPDYLLYPERDTKIERSEYIRLFNNDAKLLEWTQDWTNTFKNKYAIITDEHMWDSDINSLLIALDRLKEVKNISFLEPISLQKLLSNEELKNKFLNLNFVSGSKVTWKSISLSRYEETVSFIKTFKKTQPGVKINALIIDYHNYSLSHWDNIENARYELSLIQDLICRCKKEEVLIEINTPIEDRLTYSPYFFIFEEISNWTSKMFKKSWLEYLSIRFAANRTVDMVDYWSSPDLWHTNFRDLLRQTWINKDFLLTRWGSDQISYIDVPWQMWENEFKYGI